MGHWAKLTKDDILLNLDQFAVIAEVDGEVKCCDKHLNVEFHWKETEGRTFEQVKNLLLGE